MFLAAVLCSVLLAPGDHYLSCRAEYLHGGYTHTVYDLRTTFTIVQVTGSGEGHPVRVTLKDFGTDLCSAELDLFSDDFESGNLEAWDETRN